MPMKILKRLGLALLLVPAALVWTVLMPLEWVLTGRTVLADKIPEWFGDKGIG